jgi:hypothetical protein
VDGGSLRQLSGVVETPVDKVTAVDKWGLVQVLDLHHWFDVYQPDLRLD